MLWFQNSSAVGLFLFVQVFVRNTNFEDIILCSPLWYRLKLLPFVCKPCTATVVLKELQPAGEPSLFFFFPNQSSLSEENSSTLTGLWIENSGEPSLLTGLWIDSVQLLQSEERNMAYLLATSIHCLTLKISMVCIFSHSIWILGVAQRQWRALLININFGFLLGYVNFEEKRVDIVWVLSSALWALFHCKFAQVPQNVLMNILGDHWSWSTGRTEKIVVGSWRNLIVESL